MRTTRREKAALRDAEHQRQRAEKLKEAIRDHHRAVTKEDDWAADEQLWHSIGIRMKAAA